MPKNEDVKEDIQEVSEVAEVDEQASDAEPTSDNAEEADTKTEEATDNASSEDKEVKNAEFAKLSEDEAASSSVEEFNPDEPVTVQPVKFTSFEDAEHSQGEINKNLDILMDIKLQLTVELGRTELPIKKVLELTRGSIIELEKVAGEPVELYANGKLVANGEVVVIEDNFGLRITSITDPEDRLKGL